MRKPFSFPGLSLYLVVIFALSCNSKDTNNFAVDSTHADPISDSMPVLKPPITDTSGIITTPPINDDNVILPDTSKGNRQ
jgi:hypothetical protein